MKPWPEELVSSDNLSLPLIADIFRAAYLDVKTEGNLLLVDEGTMKIWVLIDQDNKRYINFLFSFPVKNSSTHQQRTELANRINAGLIFARAAVVERSGSETINIDHYLWVEGGVTKKTIYLCLKEMATLVRAAMEKDSEGVVG